MNLLLDRPTHRAISAQFCSQPCFRAAWPIHKLYHFFPWPALPKELQVAAFRYLNPTPPEIPNYISVSKSFGAAFLPNSWLWIEKFQQLSQQDQNSATGGTTRAKYFSIIMKTWFLSQKMRETFPEAKPADIDYLLTDPESRGTFQKIWVTKYPNLSDWDKFELVQQHITNPSNLETWVAIAQAYEESPGDVVNCILKF